MKLISSFEGLLPAGQAMGQGVIFRAEGAAIWMQAPIMVIVLQIFGHGHGPADDGGHLPVGQQEAAGRRRGNDDPGRHLLQHRAQQGPLGFQLPGDPLQLFILHLQFLGLDLELFGLDPKFCGLRLQFFVGRLQLFHQLLVSLRGGDLGRRPGPQAAAQVRDGRLRFNEALLQVAHLLQTFFPGWAFWAHKDSLLR